MKIAYFSPLPPLRSGIADYSAELLTVMHNYAQIDLFVDSYQVSENLANNFQLYRMKDFKDLINKKKYDGIIYHIGNNHQYHANIYKIALDNPGIIVLHDFAIHHMLAQLTYTAGLNDKYVEEMFYNHGEEGRECAIGFINGNNSAPWDGDNAINFPMNKRLIESAKGIIVHSFDSRQRIKRIRKDVPVKVVHMHCLDILKDGIGERNKSREKLGLDHDILILSSFGFINSSRRIDKVLNALKMIRENLDIKFKYILVGEQNEVDYPLNKIINELNLQENIQIVGFAEMETYKDFMKATDVCINLRYPVHGETSANLHRMFGMGKVILVTDTGSFSEYPNNILIKVSLLNEVEDIYKNLYTLMQDNKLREAYSHKAIEFAKENCQLEKSAKDYIDFINCINSGYYKSENLVEDVAQCLIEIGLNESDSNFIDVISEDLTMLIK